jgi:hypothetical protein
VSGHIYLFFPSWARVILPSRPEEKRSSKKPLSQYPHLEPHPNRHNRRNRTSGFEGIKGAHIKYTIFVIYFIIFIPFKTKLRRTVVIQFDFFYEFCYHRRTKGVA